MTLKATKLACLLLLGLLLMAAVPSFTQADRGAANVSNGHGDSSQNAPVHYSLPPDKMVRATALYRTELLMFAVSLVYSLALLWALLHFRVGVRFRDLAERVTSKFFLRAIIVLPLTFLAIRILSLPLSIYGHHIGLSYGLSVQRWASWLVDWCKGAGIEIVVGSFVCFGLYRLMARSPRRWWVWAWAISIPLTIFAVWIVPIVLDPMFNKFEPLEKTNPALVEELSRVAHRGGLEIPASRMFEMKASEKVTTYNAYVTGVGSSKRIVVWDNTEKDMTTPETLFIFGHEMGHYVLDHIWKGIAASALLTFFGIWLGRTILLGSIARYASQWHLRSFDDLAGLPLLLLIASVLSIASMPIDSTVSRYFEHQADVYGLEITHGINEDSPEVAASSFQKIL
jgi:STE24 endopeptidase